MEPYQYQPIREANTVRMLTLSAGLPNDPLSGFLNEFNMDRAAHEAYEPLSYVWSSPIFDHTFICDGKRLAITTSLNSGLRRIRMPDRDRHVWVDQICINQKDAAERGSQVQYMNAIYKQASRVLVWLGPDTGHEADAAFSFVRSLSETLSDADRYAQFRAGHTSEMLTQRSEEEWASVKVLTQLPWFERVWIIQEIGTRAPATLFWGDASMDWYTLYSVCDRLTEFHHLRRHFDIETSKVKFVFQRFVPPDVATRHANRLSFIYELHRARHVKATDPRDRVFAFLGHYSVTGRELRGLQANYDAKTGTLPNVYWDAASRALEGGGADSGLITLAAVQHHELASSLTDWRKRRDKAGDRDYMPSWVPDWRTYTSHILSEPTSPHRACGTGSLSKPSFVVDGKSLRIKGVAIDVVTEASAPLKSKAFHKVEPGKQTLIEQLWRTVCGYGVDAGGDGGGHLFSLHSSGRREQESREDFFRSISDSQWLAQGAAYLTRTMAAAGDVEAMSPELQSLATSEGGGLDDAEWSRSANGASSGRVFARTIKGYFVLGPKVMAKGDRICVLWGGKMCFCLRPLDQGRFLLVGECYVHELMNGEAIRQVEKNELQEEEFVLV
ncbi:heterokaryon incompatibility protein-domain-containing protein [Lasiosphaeria miniovina]|uniref:Heterokaryon incompatibility protein-domain-containing protein n=1 Tax=Lasiosphaeria miniovina TaxID=1954250 RepID=A0AA40DQZ9_9PEZI|nr:heterokaryon incompatibility protein-domain-containing protein [Lasiosphaeria miniovina]KAK0710256.1 heterokaryon incompatibility protein-domain-containing protein [Lasiosphaeria miniovina]